MHGVAEICQQLISGIMATSPLEFVAVFFGVVSVWCAKKESILVYPTGVINTSIYIWLCFQGGLFAEAFLHVYYTAMCVVGFVHWRKKESGPKISTCTAKETRGIVFYFAISWGVLWFGLKLLTTSTVPMADSFASATAYTAMWLMNRKKVESWLWWILTNVVSIPLFFIKGYVFSSFLYLIYLFLAIAGFIKWRQKLKISCKY